jgi:hypothetical protein
MSCCSLDPRIFVMILVTQLMSEIGLKSLMVVGVLIFGTRVKKALLRG